jgi:nucleoside-diphosphate kinase
MSNALPKKQKTFVIIKPDGIQRSLIGDIVSRFEKTGLKLVAMKMQVLDEERLLIHYNKDDQWYESKGTKIMENVRSQGKEPNQPAIEYGKDIIRALVKYMTSGPVLVMVWEGNESVAIVKKIVGGTEPTTSDVGTIRGDLTLDSYYMANLDNRAVRNLAHCSDSPAEAEREIDIWFDPSEIINYKHINENMLYELNINGLLD